MNPASFELLVQFLRERYGDDARFDGEKLQALTLQLDAAKLMPDGKEQELEAKARDRVARFIFAVVGKLPRETVDECMRAALDGARYQQLEPLRDTYCEELAGQLLGGWALRELVNARVEELHAELQREHSTATARVEVLERARVDLRRQLEYLRNEIDRFEKATFSAAVDA